MANKNFKVKNSITIPEPLALTEGGTGQTSATNALNALLPVQSSAASKFLQSDGTNVSWVANVAYNRGGTGSRPGSPTVGDIYYNTDYNYFEQYTSAGWFVLAAAPGIPTGVTATNQGSGRAYNNGQSSVAFTASSSGGVASSFTVTPTPSTSPSTFTGSSSPVTVTGLASSTQYTYTVAATSPYGTSSASSASSGVTATTVPQAPTINSVTSSGGNAAIIDFTAGATGGSAITQYTITSTPSTTTQTTSSSPYTFTGLTLGQSYTFTMTATNANGTSASTTSSSVTIEEIDAGVMIPISSISLNSLTTTVTFSNIPQTYTHLQLICMTRISRVNNDPSSNQLSFNGDSGANYAYHGIFAGANSVVPDSGGVGSTSLMYIGTNASNGTAAGTYAPMIIDILDYTKTNKYKVARSITGFSQNTSGSGNRSMAVRSGLWLNTSAITSLSFNPNINQFMAGSTFTLYGIKGA